MYTCHIRTSRRNLPSRQPIFAMLHLGKRHTIKVGRKEFELWRGTCFLMCLTAEVREGKMVNSYTSQGEIWMRINVTKKLSSGTSVLWKKWWNSSTCLLYGVLKEHLFKFTLLIVALQRSLLENVQVKYFSMLWFRILSSFSPVYLQVRWWYLHWLSSNSCSCSLSDFKFCI